MSELTKRLAGSVCYASTNKEWPNVLLQEAADRIDNLEECLREIINSDMAQMAEDEGRVCKELNKARALLGEE